MTCCQIYSRSRGWGSILYRWERYLIDENYRWLSRYSYHE